MELLNKHVTIRKFQKKEVDDALLNNLLYSATRASTTGNMQLYSLVVTKDEKKRAEMAPLHFNQPVAKEAPVLLTFVADFNRFTKWCELNNAEPGYNNFLSFYTATIDALLAAQNFCIAAENEGLGICYLGTTVYNAKEMIELLKLPKLTFPVTTIAFGFPQERNNLTDRISLKGIVHTEEYKDYTNDAINEFYSFKENLESSKKFVEENGLKSLAQVFTDVRYKKSDNEIFSEKMIKTIREQGFNF